MLYEMACQKKLFDSDFALLEYIYTKRNPAIPWLDSADGSVMMHIVLANTLALLPFIRPTAKGLRAACVFRWYSEIGSMEDSNDVAIDIGNLLTGSQAPNIGLTGIDTR